MTPNMLITLYRVSNGRDYTYTFPIWSSDSSLPLPVLEPDRCYLLRVMNGPRLVYSCAPESPGFVLGRLMDLLDHTPGARFADCPKCQVATHLLPFLGQRTPDPVVEALEGLEQALALPPPEPAQDLTMPVLLSQDEADQRWEDSRPLPAIDRITVVRLPEPDRTTPALPVTHDPTTTLTRDELRTIDDKVAETVDGWTDYQCSGAYLLITKQRGIDREKAQAIRRREEAKVRK